LNSSYAIKIIDKTHNDFDLSSLEKEVMIMKKVVKFSCNSFLGWDSSTSQSRLTASVHSRWTTHIV
jgi:hypothetical protein